MKLLTHSKLMKMTGGCGFLALTDLFTPTYAFYEKRVYLKTLRRVLTHREKHFEFISNLIFWRP